MSYRTLGAVVAAALVLLTLAGCSRREAPEQRVRLLFEGAELAAEQKDFSKLRGYISSRYADPEGHDRRAIENLLRLHVLRHESVHLYTRIASIELSQPGRAQAVLYVAMAGRPIKTAEELAGLRADFYRFEFTLAEEDKEWRVTGAAWRRAEATDFL